MYKQYQLPYAYEALEPHIDALTMETHYSKHHAAYTKNLNDAAEKAGVAGRDITELLANLDSIADSGLRKAIRNNGGGYYNHNLYFSTISPDGGGEPEGALAQALTREFGGFAAFKEQLSALALGQFGSGWAWLSAGCRRQTAAVCQPEPGQPDHRRQQLRADPGHRCLGTRLLPEI